MQVAICDDEGVFRQELHKVLLNFKYDKRICIDIYEFENGENLIQSETVFDIVFLDYQMPGMDGMETARVLRARNSICSIIFITAYPEFVLESYEVQPFRFMIKPIETAKINEALDNYIRQQKLLYPLVIIEDGEQKTINAQDIIYLEGDGKYCYVRTNEETIHSSKTLAQVYKLLPQHCFYRIHKSYVINMYFIASIKGNTVTFTNGEMAIIGRNRIAEFKKVYMKFIKNYYVRM